MCPCHGGAYYRDGSRASGPPERGLFEYPYKVQDGMVTIQAANCDSGIPTASLFGKQGAVQCTERVGFHREQAVRLQPNECFAQKDKDMSVIGQIGNGLTAGCNSLLHSRICEHPVRAKKKKKQKKKKNKKKKKKPKKKKKKKKKKNKKKKKKKSRRAGSYVFGSFMRLHSISSNS